MDETEKETDDISVSEEERRNLLECFCGDGKLTDYWFGKYAERKEN